jgi:hypothetical protein
MCCGPNQRIPYLFSFGLAKCFTQNFIHHPLKGECMEKDNKKQEESKIETNDISNRVLYGSPTIGGFIVVGIVVLFILYQWFFN